MWTEDTVPDSRDSDNAQQVDGSAFTTSACFQALFLPEKAPARLAHHIVQREVEDLAASIHSHGQDQEAFPW